VRVKANNIRRKQWNATRDHDVVTGITPEGYRIIDGIAYDEFDEPVYDTADTDGLDY
jgi:hypothetical protein